MKVLYDIKQRNNQSLHLNKGVIVMKQKWFRKRGELSGPVFAIIMVIIVLLCVPAFRALMADNGTASENIGNQIVNITTP